jgi:hypothetical protein
MAAESDKEGAIGSNAKKGAEGIFEFSGLNVRN